MPASKQSTTRSKRKARPIWSGHISFGLVNIPVSLRSTEIPKETVEFDLLDKRDQAHVGYQRINKETGEIVDPDNIVKGYEYAKGRYVTFTDEELTHLKAEGSQNLEIGDFVDASAIEWVYFSKAYFLVPQKGAEKAYALLREALKRTHKVGLASIVIHGRQHLSALAARGPVIVLELLHFYHEIQDAKGLDLPSENLKAIGISEREVNMAEDLIAGMSAPWKPQHYRDTYYREVMRYVERKARKGEAEAAAMFESEAAPEAATNVVDLMPLLKKSLQQKVSSKRRSSEIAK